MPVLQTPAEVEAVRSTAARAVLPMTALLVQRAQVGPPLRARPRRVLLRGRPTTAPRAALPGRAAARQRARVRSS